MNFEELIQQPADWMTGNTNHHNIVLTSRVRLARNIQGHEFPGWAKKEQRIELAQVLLQELQKLPELTNGFIQNLDSLESLEKQVLVERHLISREQAARGKGSAVAINEEQTLSLLINEEDHFRLQGIQTGFALGMAYHLVSQVDDKLQERLSFSYDPQLGYLTACPTNLGTGMRASVMLHLPGLVLADQIKPILNAANQYRYTVRGLYGEGSESLGNLFQVSNQSTLGEHEQDIISKLEQFISDLVEAEEHARLKLFEDKPDLLKDHISRAYGILTHAHIISSLEALNLLSLLRFGASLNFLPTQAYEFCDLLLMKIQPAHLQLYANRDLHPNERDHIRAEMIRTQLQSLTSPAIIQSSQEKMPNRPNPES